MRRLVMICLLASVLVAGCKPKPYTGAPRDLHRELGSGSEPLQAPVLEPSAAALGPEVPYLPLVQPPEVKRVWVTAHLNEAGDMIAGHWVYLMLESSSWLLRYKGPQKFELKLPPRVPIAVPPAEGQQDE